MNIVKLNKRIMNKIFRYLLSGFIILIPFFVLYQTMKSISSLMQGIFPEAGFVAAFLLSLFVIVFLGFLISKGVGGFLRNIISKKSQQDGLLAFILKLSLNFKMFSEKTEKIFQNPVYFEVSDGIHKFGFITNDDVEFLTSKDDEKRKIAVYAPNPISFMGELLLIEKRMIKKIDKNKENMSLFLYTAGIIKKF